MEWIRRWSAQVRLNLGDLTVSQKLLMGTLTIVIAMIVWVVVMYASTPSMQALLDQPMTAAERARITDYLSMRGMDYEVVGDRVYVPPARHEEALAGLMMQQLLPSDTSAGFDSIIEAQSWWHSTAQNRQIQLHAKTQLLAQVLRKTPWVQDATVIIDEPDSMGFGRTVQRPSASVSLTPVAGQKIDRAKVDAVVGLVVGAEAGLLRSDVTVMDANAGRQYRSDDESQFMTGEALELVQNHERLYRDKIEDALIYIRNVIVAVNVDVDLTRKQTDTTRFDRDNSVELLASENTTNSEDRSAGSSGEPGVRANTGADISNGGGSVVTNTMDTSDTTFNTHAGRTHEIVDSPGGLPNKVYATVNVPRSYFVILHRNSLGDPQAPEPTDEVLAPLVQEHLERIRQQVIPLVATAVVGEVVVDVFPDGGVDIELQTATMAGGMMAMFEGGWMSQAWAGALALVSVIAMFWMLRRAAQQPPVPSARELAGIPPILEEEETLVGEAGESASTLPGMEVPEGDLQHRQMIDQISDLVKDNPADVARVAKRLIQRAE